MAQPLKSPQDACWDNMCPMNSSDPVEKIKKDKLECLQDKQEAVCACCQNSGAPDCNVLIPDYGLIDVCKPTNVVQAKGNETDNKFQLTGFILLGLLVFTLVVLFIVSLL